MQSQGDRLLSVGEVAEMLNCSVRNVWKLMSSGRLGPGEIRIGRLVRFRLGEVLAWLQAGAPSRADWQRRAQGGQP